MKKGVLISLIIPIALIFAAASVFIILDATVQRNIHLDSGCEKAGPFPLRGSSADLEIAPGLVFRVSSVSSLSAITPETLEKLKEMGCKVDSSSTVIFGRDMRANIRMITKLYIVDLPFATYDYYLDTLANHRVDRVVASHPLQYIRDMEFVPAMEGDPNSFGIDFLENFTLEYNYGNAAMAFHVEPPVDFERCGDMTPGYGLRDLIGTGNRYYVDMKIDHEPYRFLVNTSLLRVPVKLSLNNLSRQNNHTQTTTVKNVYSQELDAVLDRNAWCEFGNRAGGRKVFFYNDVADTYEINPALFFHQDLLLDFRRNGIYLHPEVDPIEQKTHRLIAEK